MSCDLAKPCSRCVARQVSCTYIKAFDDPSNSRGSDPLRPLNRHEEGEKSSVGFLLDLTDPKASSMINSLLREPVADPQETSLPMHKTFFMADLPGDALFQGLYPWSFTQMLSEDPQTEAHLSEVATDCDVSNIVLASRMETLISELKITHKFLSDSDPFYDDTFDEDLARTVFSARNAKSFTSSYFQLNHHSFPICHKPSFDTDTCLLHLMLALMLNGSTRLVPQDDALSAVKFFRISEAYVFRCLETAVAAHVKGKPPSKELIDTLAAALAIHGITAASAVTRARDLVNSQRIPFIVGVIRQLELASLRHPKPLQETEWSDFIHVESCLRYDAVANVDCCRASRLTAFHLGSLHGRHSHRGKNLVARTVCRSSRLQR